MKGWLLRGGALAGALAALAWAHVAWWVHRSDLAVERFDWDSAARDRGMAAVLAPFVPGSAVELLPPRSLSKAAAIRVQPDLPALLGEAVSVAPYDFRLWELIIGRIGDGSGGAAKAAAAALTFTGRGMPGAWLTAGERLLSEGDVAAAVAAFLEGTKMVAPGSRAVGTVFRTLVRRHVPIPVLLQAAPQAELNRRMLAETLLAEGYAAAAGVVVRKGLEETPGSRALTGIMNTIGYHLGGSDPMKRKEYP
jgi:hypothetical protein